MDGGYVNWWLWGLGMLLTASGASALALPFLKNRPMTIGQVGWVIVSMVVGVVLVSVEMVGMK